MAEEKKEQEMKREDEVENESDEVVTIARVPPWTKQITVRGVVTSAIIGVIYSIIAMKLNLTTGLSPNLNVSAALLAFVFIRAWNQILKKAGFSPAPFTKQENTMIQTCAVACYSIAIGGLKSLYLSIYFCTCFSQSYL